MSWRLPTAQRSSNRLRGGERLKSPVSIPTPPHPLPCPPIFSPPTLPRSQSFVSRRFRRLFGRQALTVGGACADTPRVNHVRSSQTLMNAHRATSRHPRCARFPIIHCAMPQPRVFFCFCFPSSVPLSLSPFYFTSRAKRSTVAREDLSGVIHYRHDATS